MGELRMPALGADMERGTLVEWRVAPGDAVARGDIVAVVDTDKSTIEIEGFEDGIVGELLAQPGDELPVGAPLATIRAAAGAEPPARARAADTRPPAPAPAPAPGPVWGTSRAPARPPLVTSPLVRHLAESRHVAWDGLVGTGPGGSVTRADVERAAALAVPPPATAPTPRTPTAALGAPPPAPPGGGRRRASPAARRLAARRGLDLGGVTGTGPGGAVILADVESAPAAAPRRPPSKATRRAALADLMARSKREIPHYYLSTTIELGDTLAWLTAENEARSVRDRIVPAALLLRAAARAARSVPVVNGWYVGDRFQSADHVDLGVAISLRGGGLVAPAIARADERSLDDLMGALRELVARARSGILRGSDLVPPTLTVTNLGDQGVEVVHGVIYPPQVALAGFGTIVERPWAVDGAVVARPVVTASVAGDHRVSDGHDGARFLAAVAQQLQRRELP